MPGTNPTNLVSIFTRPLNGAEVSYMVTGSIASILYGEPRLTADIDFVLSIPPMKSALLTAIFPIDDFYCPPEEVIRAECARSSRGHFNLIHHQTGFKADIYLASKGPLHQWGLAHRREHDFGEEPIWVAPPEYVILRKLEYFQEGRSEKHLRDIRGILDSGSPIDHDALSDLARQVGLVDLVAQYVIPE